MEKTKCPSPARPQECAGLAASIEVMGREFLDKLAEQEIKVQDMSGAALAGLGRLHAEVPVVTDHFRCRRDR